MSINTTSTNGFFGVNGSLNIQTGICASTYSYFDSSFNKVDITNNIKNVGQSINVTNADANTGPYYVPLVSSTTTGTQSLNVGSLIVVDPKDNVVGIAGTLVVMVGAGIINCNQLTGCTLSGTFPLSTGTTIGGVTQSQLTSLSTISGAIVDIGSTQTITGAKTFSGGITVSSEVDTGNLTVSGLFSQNKATNLYYTPNAYGSKIVVATASQNLLTSGNTGTIYKWYHISTTYTTTTPTLLLPDPVVALAGVEIYFVRCGAANAVNLQTVSFATANTSNFLISSSSTNITPSFTLGSTWYKVGFVCLLNPDATGTQYAWNQILYQ